MNWKYKTTHNKAELESLTWHCPRTHPAQRIDVWYAYHTSSMIVRKLYDKRDNSVTYQNAFWPTDDIALSETVPTPIQWYAMTVE